MAVPYAITSRTLSYVRYRATLAMQYLCVVERVVNPSYDQTTLLATPGDRTTIYTGRCRIRDLMGENAVLVGDVDVVIQQTQISLPWDIPVLPDRNDEITITQVPPSGDVALTGKRFQIQNTGKAGELRATRTFGVILMDKTS